MISAKSNMFKYDKALELLIQAEIVNLSQLEEVRVLAEKTKYPFNRMLASTGIVSNTTLNNAYLATKQISEGLIDTKNAVKILKHANSHKTDFESALSELNQEKQKVKVDFELFLNLLLDSDLINIKELEHAFSKSNNSNLTFTRVLTELGLIPEFMINPINDVLSDIKTFRIDYDAACQTLQQAVNNPALFISERSSSTKTFKIGELLTCANLISHEDNQDIVFESLVTGNLVGEAFVKRGLIDIEILNSALEIQASINSGSISLPYGIKVLKANNSDNQSIDSIIGQNAFINTEVIKLLLNTKQISQAALDFSKKLNDSDLTNLNCNNLAQALNLSEERVALAHDCVKLLLSSDVSDFNIQKIYNYCLENDTDIDSAIENLDLEIINECAT